MCVILHRSCRSIKGVHASSQPPSQIQKKNTRTAHMYCREVTERVYRTGGAVRQTRKTWWHGKMDGKAGRLPWSDVGRGGEGRGAHLSSKTHKLIPNQVVFTTLERNPHCDAFVDRCHQVVQNGLKKKKKCINESVQHVSSSHIQILLLIFLELCSKGKNKYQMKGN